MLAGGCFWGVQGVFQHVKGVTQAESGYAGGTKDTADYETVSTGTTGHAESVRITYDPSQVTLRAAPADLLLRRHRPHPARPAGARRGHAVPVGDLRAGSPPSSRSRTPTSPSCPRRRVFPAPIVTKVEPNTGFFPAEQYHQDFLNSNPSYPYIAINDMPKVDALKQLFPTEYSAQPVLVGKMIDQ